MVMRAPSALLVRRLSLLPGTFRRSPKVAIDDVRALRKGDGVVYVGVIGDADGAAGPREHLDGRRQHLPDAEPVYGVRVGAAELHHLDRSPGCGPYARFQLFDDGRVAKALTPSASMPAISSRSRNVSSASALPMTLIA